MNLTNCYSSHPNHSSQRTDRLTTPFPIFKLCLTLCLTLCLAFSLLSGCDDSSSESSSMTDLSNMNMTELNGTEVYEFSSRDGEDSSVSISGQIARHALIEGLKSYMNSLESGIAQQGVFEEGELTSVFSIFFDCIDDICGDESITVSSFLPLKQANIADLSSGKNLLAKLAGQDPVGQHKDWANEFIGWGQDTLSPEALIRDWFTQVEEQAISISNGEMLMTPKGELIQRPDLSSTGLDYTQLTQKFLLGAVAFSQGVDDYLDDSEDGKGILSDHTALVEGKSYTELEHSWDEAFGYFGAARNYLAYSDDEVAQAGGREDFQGANDLNNDDQIDLLSEYNWGHSLNASKRDRGHSTDLSQKAFAAFYRGRLLLASTNTALSTEELTQLKIYRDTAVLAWEKAISATVVHYINACLNDLDSGAEYDFATYAKHWSEMKGFALSFQFNPRSPLSSDQFSQLHTLLGTAPTMPDHSDATSYRMQLLEARSLLANAYLFEQNDVDTW